MAGEKVVLVVTIEDCTIQLAPLEKNVSEVLQSYLGPRGRVTYVAWIDEEDQNMLGLDEE
jgi:hypothetical protein